jgi:hypothetical protein
VGECKGLFNILNVGPEVWVAEWVGEVEDPVDETLLPLLVLFGDASDLTESSATGKG